MSFHLNATVHNQQVQFLVDTGASLSLLPSKYIHPSTVRPSNFRLQSVTGAQIRVLGEVQITVGIRPLHRNYQWKFIVTDSTPAILGLDFLSQYNFLIDCKNCRLHDPETHFTIATTRTNPTLQFETHQYVFPPAVIKLLEQYPAVKDGPAPGSTTLLSPVTHRIDTGSSAPTFCRARPLYGEKLEAARSEFQHLLDTNIIRPSSSAWSSPLHMVPKKQSRTWRPCGDYRQLNTITKPDRYPIPHLQACTSRFYNAKVFSKIDLERAYHQVPVHPDDIEKTAIVTPFGLFEYLSMPFGLRNAAQTFQRHMDNIFRDCLFATVYLDDILVASPDENTHISHLNQIFSRLSENHLRLNLAKCSFMQQSVCFLGHEISTQGILPAKERISAIQEFPRPDTYSCLRRFLGMVNFYRRFLPNFASTIEPLQHLVNSTPDKKKPLQWNESSISAFADAKSALEKATALHSPSSSPHYQLVTDASKEFVGAALHAINSDNQPVPVGFFSKKLSPAQRNYSTYDRELLAAYLAAKHFLSFIEGAAVHLITDHKPIVSAFHSRSQCSNERQQRHLSFLSEICSDASHIKGSNNIVADTLSRPIAAVSLDPFDLSYIATQQTEAGNLDNSNSSLQLSPFALPNGSSILCDTSTNVPRPFLPPSCRRSAFDELHNLSHPGVNSSVKLVKSRYIWPSIDKDVKQWVRECQSCQESKIHKHTKSPPQEFSVPNSSRFECVHIDIVGPLPPAYSVDSPRDSTAYRYIVTFMDRATRWVEAHPLTTITAAAVAEAFLHAWVARFGVPLLLITDQGRQFESNLFQCLSRTLGFHRLRTAAYHPQSNGKLERVHRTIKTALKARKANWLQSLPVVLMAIRATPNDSGYSPFTAVTGAPILIPSAALSSHKTSLTDFTKFLLIFLHLPHSVVLSSRQLFSPQAMCGSVQIAS